jgi:nicotinamide-nucleotide amidase
MDATPTAACLAIGSELLGTDKLDRNSLKIAATLARFGVELREKRVVGDDVRRIAEMLESLVDRYDVVITTGGLGPTADDVTREAVARALGRSLQHDHEVEGWVRDRYVSLGRDLPDLCLKMALVVDGARPLPPDRGTAPGLLLHVRGKLLASFPGVPWELEGMMERDLEPELAVFNPGVRRITRTLLLGGVVEAEVEHRIRHLYERFGRENVTILASTGVVRLVLAATGEERSARHHLGEMERAFCGELGSDVAGVDVAGLEDVVVAALGRRGETLAVAESCTGGLLGATVTRVSGASTVFAGGVISYSNDVKRRLLDVSGSDIDRYGAVSEQVAKAMASGARANVQTDWGVGITGVAGPTGGTDDKPVGLVHWAVAGPDGVVARHRVFPGNRDLVRRWTVNASLDLLRRLVTNGGA